MSVKIIVDSTCDYSPKEITAYGLLRAPLTLHWDGKEYDDGVIAPPEFFVRLANSDKLPTTSQVPVPTFEALFHQVLGDGDEAVVILLSKKLSGTYQSATIARDGLATGQDNIHLVDGGTGSLGTMLLIREAIKLRDTGSSAAEIVAIISELSTRLYIYAGVETLKYLHKGGRLSTGAAIMGTLLSVKPVLTVQQGIVSVAHKVRGVPAAYRWIADHIMAVGLDPRYPVTIGSTQCPQLLQDFTAVMDEAIGTPCTTFCDIGPVIGTHTGPGTVAIAFIAKA